MTDFNKEYWIKNYSQPEDMDCIGNAKGHAKYLKSLFDLEYIHITSIIDFGFGHGELFKQMMRAFIPYKAVGIEPSQYIFNKTKNKKLAPVASTKLKLINTDLVRYLSRHHKTVFDLGICTSVMQYLSEKELKIIIPLLSKQVKYLYLTVPTNDEMERQIENHGFKDEYAILRNQNYYLKLLRPHFTFIGNRLLESKYHFNVKTTDFTDLLFRL
jgi:hypothetical protein